MPLIPLSKPFSFEYFPSQSCVIDVFEKIGSFSNKEIIPTKWASKHQLECYRPSSASKDKHGDVIYGYSVGASQTFFWKGVRGCLLTGCVLALLHLALKNDLVSFYMQDKTVSTLSRHMQAVVAKEVASGLRHPLHSLENLISSCSVSIVALAVLIKTYRRSTVEFVAPQSEQLPLAAVEKFLDLIEELRPDNDLSYCDDSWNKDSPISLEGDTKRSDGAYLEESSNESGDCDGAGSRSLEGYDDTSDAESSQKSACESNDDRPTYPCATPAPNKSGSRFAVIGARRWSTGLKNKIKRLSEGPSTAVCSRRFSLGISAGFVDPRVSSVLEHQFNKQGQLPPEISPIASSESSVFNDFSQVKTHTDQKTVETSHNIGERQLPSPIGNNSLPLSINSSVSPRSLDPSSFIKNSGEYEEGAADGSTANAREDSFSSFSSTFYPQTNSSSSISKSNETGAEEESSTARQEQESVQRVNALVSGIFNSARSPAGDTQDHRKSHIEAFIRGVFFSPDDKNTPSAKELNALQNQSQASSNGSFGSIREKKSPNDDSDSENQDVLLFSPDSTRRSSEGPYDIPSRGESLGSQFNFGSNHDELRFSMGSTTSGSIRSRNRVNLQNLAPLSETERKRRRRQTSYHTACGVVPAPAVERNSYPNDIYKKSDTLVEVAGSVDEWVSDTDADSTTERRSPESCTTTPPKNAPPSNGLTPENLAIIRNLPLLSNPLNLDHLNIIEGEKNPQATSTPQGASHALNYASGFSPICKGLAVCGNTPEGSPLSSLQGVLGPVKHTCKTSIETSLKESSERGGEKPQGLSLEDYRDLRESTGQLPPEQQDADTSGNCTPTAIATPASLDLTPHSSSPITNNAGTEVSSNKLEGAPMPTNRAPLSQPTVADAPPMRVTNNSKLPHLIKHNKDAQQTCKSIAPSAVAPAQLALPNDKANVVIVDQQGQSAKGNRASKRTAPTEQLGDSIHSSKKQRAQRKPRESVIYHHTEASLRWRREKLPSF